MANILPAEDVPIVGFELEGYGDARLKFEMKGGGYYLMNFPIGKSEEEETNGVKCDVVKTGIPDAFGTICWNLYIDGRLCGTVPPKYLYDDDVIVDLALVGPSPSTPPAAAAYSRNNDSDCGDDGDFWEKMRAIDRAAVKRDEIDKTNARIDKEKAKRKMQTGLLADRLVEQAEGLATAQRRIQVMEANQEELLDLVEDLKKRIIALEAGEN